MTNISNNSNLRLPQPSPEAIAHSYQVLAFIKNRIQLNGGKITFAEYMQLVLYAPGLGYYSAGANKFGAAGDFVTAPEISPLFGQAIAKQCEEILLNNQENNTIFELGAGTGILAATLLLELERLSCLPARYLILEISADLRQRQQETLAKYCPHLLSRIYWINDFPEQPIKGVIIANEVIDAMPVHYFQIHNEHIHEYYVCNENDQLSWTIAEPSSEELFQEVKKIQAQLPEQIQSYSSEINLALPAWIKRLSNSLSQGLILLIDYGFPHAEYYHPDRSTGTLMCHYRHYAHTNPLLWPGLQDITAHVDFTAIAEAASMENLSVSGYASQAGFLLGCGIAECLQNRLINANDAEEYTLNQHLKKLTLPNEMGELFKVIGLTRNVNKKLRGFSLQDRRGQL